MSTATVLTGPPADKTADGMIVDDFIKSEGIKIVCGGTTAKIVARHLKLPLEVDLETITEDVPPMGRIKGIDMVSEGTLTLTKVKALLASGSPSSCNSKDGAAHLVRALLDAKQVHFIVGTAVNPVHQRPDVAQKLGTRIDVVHDIAKQLRKRKKEISIVRI